MVHKLPCNSFSSNKASQDLATLGARGGQIEGKGEMSENETLRPVNELCYLSLKTIGHAGAGDDFSILQPCGHGYQTTHLMLQMARDRLKGKYVCGICLAAPAKLVVYSCPSSSAAKAPRRIIATRYNTLDIDIVVAHTSATTTSATTTTLEDAEVIRSTLSIPKGKMKLLPTSSKRVVVMGTHEKVYEFDKQQQSATAAETRVATFKSFVESAWRIVREIVMAVPSFFLSMIRPPKRE